jgi:hypothetical protein
VRSPPRCNDRARRRSVTPPHRQVEASDSDDGPARRDSDAPPHRCRSWVHPVSAAATTTTTCVERELSGGRWWALGWGAWRALGGLLVLAACGLGAAGRGRQGTLSVAAGCALSAAASLVTLTVRAADAGGPVASAVDAWGPGLLPSSGLWRDLAVQGGLAVLLVVEGAWLLDALLLALMLLNTRVRGLWRR